MQRTVTRENSNQAPLPEIKKIVEKYEIGTICTSHEPTIIAESLTRMLTDQPLYNKMKNNTKIAAAELTWANECKVLEKIYL